MVCSFEMLSSFPDVYPIDYLLVIPDYAKMRYIARAPVNADLVNFVKRLKACFEYVMVNKCNCTTIDNII